jgi:tagaturonate epimerase
MLIGKYSIGIGDRFAHQGEAQLTAIQKAKNELGVDLVPVWNKSNREHTIIGSSPADTRREADEAVNKLGWKGQYFVDADHINLSNVEKFIDACDFFTIDVADYIGKKAEAEDISKSVLQNKSLTGYISIPGIDEAFLVTETTIRNVADKFLFAVVKAAEIYSFIKNKKGEGRFVTEVSMDEVNAPQTPLEMLIILKLLADKKIPLQTIAPRFSGRFNKGVNYVGNVDQFGKEFEEDLLVIDFAIKNFGLPATLKLSVHSGSDKFDIYPVIGRLLKKHNKGLHLKTAGTTWLEEVIGLSIAGGEALELVKEMYEKMLEKIDELCAPYASVINIDRAKLSSVKEISGWSSEKIANTIQHIPGHPDFNPDMRQLFHVGFKIAAQYGDQYTGLLKKYKPVISKCVIENLYNRHFCRLFS